MQKLLKNQRGLRVFTEDQLNYIINTYPENGYIKAFNFFDRKFTKYQIIQAANTNGVFRNREKFDTPNFILEDFMNPKDPSLIYFLGFAWADGHLTVRNGQAWNLNVSIGRKDKAALLEIIGKIGRFSINDYTRKEGHEYTSIILGNTKVAQFLESLDFRLKSLVSPTKILQIIPEELQRYFWLGFFDGDGTLGCQDGYSSALRFSGSYNQDWTDLREFLLLMNCSPNISKIIQGNDPDRPQRASRVSVTRIPDIIHLCRFLYKDYEHNKIGLDRKYQKYLQVEKKYLKMKDSYSGHKGVAKRPSGFFTVSIKFERKTIYLGTYENFNDALLAFDLKAVGFWGHRAKTNFPIENYLTLGNPYQFPLALPSPPLAMVGRKRRGKPNFLESPQT